MSEFFLGKKRNFEDYEIKLPFKEITTEKIIEYETNFINKNNNINLFCEIEAKKKLFNEKDEIKEENNNFKLFNDENSFLNNKNEEEKNFSLFENNNNNNLFKNNLYENSYKNYSIFSPLNTKNLFTNFDLNFNNFNKKSNFLNNKNNEKKEENSYEFFNEENNKNENKLSIIIKKEDENYIKKYSKNVDDIFIFSNDKKFISKGNGILSIEFSKEKSYKKIAILIFRNQTGKILIEGCFNKKFDNLKNYVKNLKNIVEFSIIEINEKKQKNFCLIKIPFSNKEDLNEFISIYKETMKFIS